MANLSRLARIATPTMLVMTAFLSNVDAHPMASCVMARNQSFVCRTPALVACCNKTRTAQTTIV